MRIIGITEASGFSMELALRGFTDLQKCGDPSRHNGSRQKDYPT